MHGGHWGAEQSRDFRRAAEAVDDRVCLGFHNPQYAIVGNKSQASTCDNRDCDIRRAVPYRGVATQIPLRPEAAAVFDRLEALGVSQRALAGGIGLEENKLSKIKSGERQFRGLELVRALDWLKAEEAHRRVLQVSDHPPTRSAGGGEAVEIISLDLSLSMGPGTIIDDFVESEPVVFDASVLRRITRSPFERLRVVTGIGSSHDPIFQHNDQFLIDINERKLSRFDGYYWITFDDAHALKRLRPLGGGRLQIISENPTYGPLDVNADEVRIEGRAIWFARGL